jgi:hypothetical protein
MNEQKTTEQTLAAALTDDELKLVVGGGGNPTDPVGNATGRIDVESKATPILL